MLKFIGKMPNAKDTTSNEGRALTLTVRTPSVWPRCLGTKMGIVSVDHGFGIK